jgi:hypothetical protein
MIGEVLDHYRVLELVGRGAMGVVYKALDVNLDRQVAIKVMSAEARNDPDFVERFRLEARAQGALNHPNVALLFDYFVHEGTPVAVIEFIDGESLEQLIKRRGATPAHEAVPIFKQALRGVAAAHRAGIVHRDLKPGNLMVTRDGTVKVMDFGIAKRAGVTGATKVSTSIGSPLYMAPEQILGRAVDCRTDIYALGITLYELLCGQRPFNSRGKAEYLVLDAHVNDLPEPPTVYRYGIPQPIVDAVMRSLAKDPDARFQSAEEFMNALPDTPAPDVLAPRADPGSAGEPARVGPTGTVALGRSPPAADSAAARGPTGTLVIATRTSGDPAAAHVPSGTLALEYSQPVSADPVATREPSGTTFFEYAPPAEATAPRAVATNAAPVGMPRPARRANRFGIAAALVAALALAALLSQPLRLRAMLPGASPASKGTPLVSVQASPLTQRPASMEPAAPPSSIPAPEATATPVTSASAAPATDEHTTPPPAPARADLSGTWRGAYVDASGKQLLRIVSLSISRVHDDGGIEGTLQYEAASGDGECKLYPRGSNYSPGEQRLQLSPESCSPHYPKELGVPLDFARVNPRANTLGDGRIEAPTGEVIKVGLQRVRRP